MSKKNRKEEHVVETVEESNEPQEVVRGDRGEVGVATAGDTIRRMWHEATHLRVDVGNHQNPRKREWVRKAGTPSLKRFARELVAKGDAVAKEWFANKRGANNAKRTDANRTRASLERQASKAARRKKSDSNKSKAKAVDTLAPAK